MKLPSRSLRSLTPEGGVSVGRGGPSPQTMSYSANPTRYDTMPYRNCGRSGLKLPVLSLGLWQNFGASRDYASAMEILGCAFDAGITHFDFANNYGPPPRAY
jgi:hypothetical protein